MFNRFIGSDDINTLEQARAYLNGRAADAVACYNKHGGSFKTTVDLAKYLAKYW